MAALLTVIAAFSAQGAAGASELSSLSSSALGSFGVPSVPNIDANSVVRKVTSESDAAARTNHDIRVNNIVMYTNAKRAQHGLPPVTVRPELSAIAQDWAERNMRENHLYHRPQHWNVYPGYIPAGGENILQAWDDYSDEYLVQLWYDSPGHKKIMLDPRAKSIGVGIVIAPNGKLYAVQNYGR